MSRVCKLLDIEYSIIQGGMTWIANAELAAAVSKAGGLGTISPNAGMRIEDNVERNLRSQIDLAKSLTSRPFSVNIVVLIPEISALVDVLIAEGVKVVTTASGNPRLHTRRLKEAGIKVLHVVSSVRQAQGAEMDRRGTAADGLLTYIGVGRSRMGQLEGDVGKGELYAGAIGPLYRERGGRRAWYY